MVAFNLTSWGYKDCFPNKNDGSYGGNLTRLLFRTLPQYYPSGSSYSHFPLLVPEKVKGYFEAMTKRQAEAGVKEGVVGKYTYTRPVYGKVKPVVVRRWGDVKDVVGRKEVFEGVWEERVGVLLGKRGNGNVEVGSQDLVRCCEL